MTIFNLIEEGLPWEEVQNFHPSLDVTIIHGNFNCTPFQYAAILNRPDLMEHLFNESELNNDGYDVLCQAISQTVYPEVVEKFFELGFDPLFVVNDSSAFMEALESNQYALIRDIIVRWVNIFDFGTIEEQADLVDFDYQTSQILAEYL